MWQLQAICKDIEADTHGQIHYVDAVQKLLAADQPKQKKAGKKKGGKKVGKK